MTSEQLGSSSRADAVPEDRVGTSYTKDSPSSAPRQLSSSENEHFPPILREARTDNDGKEWSIAIPPLFDESPEDCKARITSLFNDLKKGNISRRLVQIPSSFLVDGCSLLIPYR